MSTSMESHQFGSSVATVYQYLSICVTKSRLLGPGPPGINFPRYAAPQLEKKQQIPLFGLSAHNPADYLPWIAANEDGRRPQHRRQSEMPRKAEPPPTWPHDRDLQNQLTYLGVRSP
ncbi:hypothetical protein BaRGS_00006428 [Batillaria attramentaria]|uniref:Uncharacterized protein n=1 Tax=Batillaria attramentaria TaxID=370345 RepID=A0ABD0LS95_9CAEN